MDHNIHLNIFHYGSNKAFDQDIPRVDYYQRVQGQHFSKLLKSSQEACQNSVTVNI